MTDHQDFNSRIVEEFRANAGVVGGPFAGVPIVLVHHVGRKSGTARIAPLAYHPGEGGEPVYIFASKGGAPAHPDWYHNLVAAGRTEIERGTERYAVTVTELTGAERERVYTEQIRRVPIFAQYAARAEGHREIPVLALTRIG